MARHKSGRNRSRGCHRAGGSLIGPFGCALAFTLFTNLLMGNSAEQRARDDHPMNFRGSFADSPHARLAVPSLQRQLLAHPVAAMNLHGAIDHLAQHLAGIQFRNRSFGAKVLLAVGLPRAVPGEPARRAQLNRRVRQHPLDRLASCEQLAEGAAPLRVRDRHSQGRHPDADVARRIWKPQACQEVQAQVETLAFFAEPLFYRNDAVFEGDLVRNRGRADGPNWPWRETRLALLDNEAGDALATGLRIGACEDDAPLRLVRVRDENLGPV